MAYTTAERATLIDRYARGPALLKAALATGQHSESGRYGAEDWLKTYAEHLEGHARQIERNLAAWNSR